MKRTVVMKIFKIQFFAGLLLMFSCAGNNRQQFVGLWQDSPEMASSWTDTYQFFDNGKFVFYYSQMICDKREVNFFGTWEMSGSNLVLNVTGKKVVEGGELVPSVNCASEYEIEGGEDKIVKLLKTDIRVLSLSAVATDTAYFDRAVVKFNGKAFWKIDNDPKGYQ
jgi:hypothetical protein